MVFLVTFFTILSVVTAAPEGRSKALFSAKEKRELARLKDDKFLTEAQYRDLNKRHARLQKRIIQLMGTDAKEAIKKDHEQASWKSIDQWNEERDYLQALIEGGKW
jgi:hypothetical protein